MKLVQPSIQEQFFPEMTCFGCGPANAKGLHLRSFAANDGEPGNATIARFTPWPEHDNGLGYLNGGIICTLLDCHSATPMFVRAEELGLLGQGALLPYVTAGLDVSFVRPTPLLETLELHAEVIDVEDKAARVSVELRFDGKTRAAATALWKPWRPR